MAARWRSSRSTCCPICWSMVRAASVAAFTSAKKLLVFRGGIKFLFGCLARRVLILQIFGIHLGKFGLVTAPRPQTEEFIVERPGNGQHQKKCRNEHKPGHGPACNWIIRRKLRHPVPPSRFDSAAWSNIRLNTEPRRHPDVLDAKHQPKQNLDRQAQHQHQKQFRRHHLQQGHALENLPAEICKQQHAVR